MKTLRALAAVAAIAFLSGRAAQAQEPPQVPGSAGSELGQSRLDFEYGKFKEVLQRTRNLLDRGGTVNLAPGGKRRCGGGAAMVRAGQNAYGRRLRARRAPARGRAVVTTMATTAREGRRGGRAARR